MCFVWKYTCAHAHTLKIMQHIHLNVSIPELSHSIHLSYANLGHEVQRPNANKRSASRCFEFPARWLLLLKCKLLLLSSYRRGWRERVCLCVCVRERGWGGGWQTQHCLREAYSAVIPVKVDLINAPRGRAAAVKSAGNLCCVSGLVSLQCHRLPVKISSGHHWIPS